MEVDSESKEFRFYFLDKLAMEMPDVDTWPLSDALGLFSHAEAARKALVDNDATASLRTYDRCINDGRKRTIDAIIGVIAPHLGICEEAKRFLAGPDTES